MSQFSILGLWNTYLLDLYNTYLLNLNEKNITLGNLFWDLTEV